MLLSRLSKHKTQRNAKKNKSYKKKTMKKMSGLHYQIIYIRVAEMVSLLQLKSVENYRREV